MLPSYSKPLSTLGQLLYSVAEKWQGARSTRVGAQPQLPESLAWQQVKALAPSLLEARITVRTKPSLGVWLTTLHSELQFEYHFERPAAGHDWQLVQVWDPLAQ